MASLPELIDRREVFAALKISLSVTAPITVPLEEVVPSGVPALDSLLGGGFPRGTLVTLEGNGGRWSIAARLIAQVTQRGIAAVIDDGSLYPPGLVEAGARLERILIVPAYAPILIARSIDVLLRSRACGVVVMPAVALADALWMRLVGLARRTGVVLIAIGASIAASLALASGLRLHCTREQLVADGSSGPWCTFTGHDLCLHVYKSKRAMHTLSAHMRVANASLR